MADKKIICIGDSVTYGYGLEAHQCWVGILRKKYGPVIFNAGINGDTTAGMLHRFEAHVISAKPDCVFIMGGGNDIVMQYSVEFIENNIYKMIELARANGIEPFVGLSPNPESRNVPMEWKTMTDYGYIVDGTYAVRDRVTAYCQERGIKCLDFDAGLRKKLKSRYGLYFLDGVHPDINGHRFMAGLAEEFLVENGVFDRREAPDWRR